MLNPPVLAVQALFTRPLSIIDELLAGETQLQHTLPTRIGDLRLQGRLAVEGVGFTDVICEFQGRAQSGDSSSWLTQAHYHV